MGQASPVEKPWCCSCSGKSIQPSNIPIQVINESGSMVACKAESILSPKTCQMEGGHNDLCQAFAAPPPLVQEQLGNQSALAQFGNRWSEACPQSLVFSPSSKELERWRFNSKDSKDSKDFDGKKSSGSQESASTAFGKDIFSTADNNNSQFTTMDYMEMTKNQKDATKSLVKDFVKSMVKGRQLTAVMPTGKTRGCFCSINRNLDTFSIRRHDKDKQGRHVSLASIIEIVVGADTSKSSLCEGLDTPLDDLSITLVLDTEECLTFRMDDKDSRDQFSTCLSMFCKQVKGE